MWKTIDEKLEIEVSDGGEIRRSGKKIPTHNLNGYEGIYIHGEHLYVHRIVAEYFCKKEKGKNIIDHIDGNKKNNKATNLRWVNYSENLKYAFEQGLRPRTTEALRMQCEKNKVKVLKIKNGIVVEKYDSISEASRKNNVSRTSIYKVLNGKRKTSGGFEWQKV